MSRTLGGFGWVSFSIISVVLLVSVLSFAARASASTPYVLFSDDMESGVGSWTLTGNGPNWSQTTDRAASGITSWFHPSNNGGTGVLVSPVIDLVQQSDAVLTFKSFYWNPNSLDLIYVNILLNGQVIDYYNFSDYPQDQWNTISLDLKEFVGLPIQLQFVDYSTDPAPYPFSGWYVDDVTVSGSNPPAPPGTNHTPFAISNGDVSGYVGQSLEFNGLQSWDVDGPIVGYAWTFGDDNSASGSSVSHIYTVPGVYTSTLTVTDSGGLTATATSTIGIADEITITSATWKKSQKQLSVQATDNYTSGTVLTVKVYDGAWHVVGNMTYSASTNSYSFTSTQKSKPTLVTVTSNQGGSATTSVTQI